MAGRQKSGQSAAARGFILGSSMPEDRVQGTIDAIFADAVRLHKAGDLPAAERLYRAVLVRDAHHAGTLHLLGVMASQRGDHHAAMGLIRQAIAANGTVGLFYLDLANALTGLGRHEEALAVCQTAARLRPDSAEILSNLGNLLKQVGRVEEAVAAYEAALRLKPDLAEAYNNLGNALKDLGRIGAAVAAYDGALVLKPDAAVVHCNRGTALMDPGRIADAIQSYAAAIRLAPNYADAYYNLGNALKDLGCGEQAIAAYRQAVAHDPGLVKAHGNLQMALHYAGCDPGVILAEARSFAAQFVAQHPTSFENPSLPNRRLRIGYVSPDFRAHSVAFFLEPVLRSHDRQAVELFCYAEIARPDAVTDRLRGLADHWRSTLGRADDEVAAQIRSDGIDILVDLAGHTGSNRLLVFARKPAPVQVSWLGYPGTTGLATIDYRLVDAVTDPPGDADRYATERLLRLAGGFLCYGPPEAPEPVPPPSASGAPLTFGSFNNPAKLSDATLDAWSALLRQAAGSRLLLKGRPFGDPATQQLFLDRLAQRGISPERVDLVSWVASAADHLKLYDRLDIALDCFPYNGTTTSCEALWMGVPVVTLAGTQHAGRVGASLLRRVGLADLVAENATAYVEIAATLAKDPARLRDLRRSMRPRLEGSPLCDAPGFARELEKAYRTIWSLWCDETLGARAP